MNNKSQEKPCTCDANEDSVEYCERHGNKGHYTPGPWHAYGVMVHDTKETVANMARIQMDGDASDSWRFKSSEHYAFCTNHADARLISAAPDLLEACSRALDAMKAEQMSQAKRGESVLVQIGIAIQECRKAIEKASAQ